MSLFRTMPTGGDFAPLFRLLDDYDVHRSGKGQTTPVRSFSPRFDVRESQDAYLLDGELPGIAQEDIEIEFSDHQTLVVKGRTERQYHSEPSDQESNQSDTDDNTQTGEKRVKKSNHRFWVNERSVGEFHRSFNFPNRVDQDNVKASLKHGVLSIVVPKATASGSKKITIE
ncbi:Hsp20/alpha crystallin family protein [Aspergillus candidus]|uniref:30 kDa heat shock protein n=1 Tax=Aspergillus candidus TaxID=41067 RepID=A0A2I2F3L1_ASPCN|nr:30 kDa heat shock protein [Aspergillus candidus]PLB35215.1 30 kDa heat shock protein [Aspergillus candidus]